MAVKPLPESNRPTAYKVLDNLKRACARALDNIASSVAQAKDTVRSGINRARDVLSGAHARAHALGRMLAGDTHPTANTDQQAGGRVAITETRYFGAVLVGASQGQYRPVTQGGQGAEKRKARCARYAERLTGTANEGYVAMISGLVDRRTGELVYGEARRVRWVLGHSRDSCSGCVEEARIGWRLPSTLTRYPGSGQTPCLWRCGCYVEVEGVGPGFRNALT